MKRRLFAFLLALVMLVPMAVAPVSAEVPDAQVETASATDAGALCSCGCGQALKDVTWQLWDPATNGNPINGHYYLDGDYVQPSQYTVQSGVRMVLDLRGHKLTTATSRLFLVYGYAAVIDTVGGGRLSAKASGTANGGAVILAWDAVAMNDEMDATFAMYNCTATLEAGTSGKNGGLFSLSSQTTLKIYSSTLVNASAKERGGAIYTSSTGSTVEMYDSSIIGCSAPTSGGAIYAMGNVTLKNCKLTGNETNGYGGSIYANQGRQTLENCVLENGISRSGSDGGGNFYAKNGCIVTITGSTIRGGYAVNNGGNVYLDKGTHTLTNTKITGGVCGKLGANFYCGSADAKTTVSGCQITGDVYYGSGSLTLKGATKIGLNSNGLKLKAGTVVKASGLTSGAEIYVDAEGVFTNSGTVKAYFKPALRTEITEGSNGLQATQADSGYCPHCKNVVTWAALSDTPSGHCYLTEAISRTEAYAITTDTVIDLRGYAITSADRVFTVSAGGSLALLDSVGGSTVKGSGNADKLGGVLQSAGPLRIYGGNYTYTPDASKPLTNGGVLYATGAVYIHGGSFDGSAFNYTDEGCTGATVYQAHSAGTFTMSAGYFKGGKAYSTGTMFIGGKTNTVTITGGILTGGYAAKNVGNLYITGGSGTGGKATISGLSIVDGTTGTGDAGNFSLCYYGKSTMTDCFIARGTSGNRGGNAYFTTNTTMTLTNCVFLAGTANQGGNFHTTATSTNVTLVNCLITDGTATSVQGGNISCGNGTVTIQGGIIAYGTAGSYGGNIANYTGQNATDDTLYLYADKNGVAPLLTGGHATTYGGNLYSSGRLVLDAAVFGTGTADTKGHDLYMAKSDVSKLTVGSGVTGEVSIGINTSYLGSNTYGGPITNTAVTELNANFILEVDGSPLLCAGDGKLCVGAVTIIHADGTEVWHSDTATAIRECPEDGWIKLYADAQLALTKDCAVDLNGNKVTVSGDYTLYAMDTSGDDYSLSTGSAQWSSPELVKTQSIFSAPNGNTYIPVIDGATVTYHCIGMKLTHVSIRPETCGIYYRGAWGSDSTLTGQIAQYGIAVSLEGVPGEDFASDPDCLYTAFSGETLISGEQKAGVIIDGIMKTELDAETNSQRGEMPIYAVAYVRLNDGTVLLSDRSGEKDDVAYSLYDAMSVMNQQIETAPGTHRRPAVQAGRDFYAQWKDSGMQNWLFPKLQAPEDDGILKIIILGSSRSVNTFQLLYEAFKDQMPDQEFVMGVMYYSGCSMTMHENFIKTNQPVYSFYHNDNGRWVITPGKYMHEGLLAENWDVVLLQAGSGDLSKNMQLETRNFLKGYIDDHLIDPYELWWHSTWFNSTDPVLYRPPKTAEDAAKVDQIKQLTQTNDAAKAYVLNDPMFAGHITSGTPMMYALKVLDVPEIDLFRDHTHLSDFGCLLVAFSFYAQYTGKPVTQINLDTIPVHLRHKEYQHLGNMTVTDEMKQIIIDTVAYTMDNLWSVPSGD